MMYSDSLGLIWSHRGLVCGCRVLADLECTVRVRLPEGYRQRTVREAFDLFCASRVK